MRPDRATRGFLALLAIGLSVGALVFCGALGGVLIPLLLSRLSGEGIEALASTSMLLVVVLLATCLRGRSRRLMASYCSRRAPGCMGA